MCPSDMIANLKNRLSEFLKPDQMIDQPEILGEYSLDHSFHTQCAPFLAVFPTIREQVQGIVKLAAENRVPLVPVSSGPPHFRGDTVPEQSGIIVDFKRMKRIHKIDPVNRCVMVEPGVTYGELIPEVTKQGLKLNLPFLPRATKSVVTSLLEREPVIIPKYQYDYLDPLLTIEVIYGTGDDFRTGSASGPGSPDTLKADKVNPWGPGTVDYYRLVSAAQGTMGMVTWAISKVEVLPSMHRLYMVPLREAKKATDIMNELLRRRIGDECLALNNVNLAIILAENLPGDYLNLKKKLPPWTLLVGISGLRINPEERMALQKKFLFEICENLGAHPSDALPGAEGRESTILEFLSNAYQKEPYWKLRLKGSCHDIFFLSALSRAAGLTQVMSEAAAKYPDLRDNIGGYIQPLVQGRGCHMEFNLFCDERSPVERDETRRLFLEGSRTLMQSGAFFSRPYGPWAGMVYSDNAAEVLALKKLKGIFDPHNILNPGKLGY
jgi:FAD/FMN-containing dehydrogenase